MITGFLNQRIQIMENTATVSQYGGTEPGYTLYWETNAEVKQLRTSRSLEANQVSLKQVFRFKVRYRRDKNIQNGMTIYWRGAWLIIQGYTPDVVYNEWVIFDGAVKNTGNLVTS